MSSRGSIGMARLAALAALVLALGACDSDILDVEDPDIVTPDQILGPAGVPVAIAGIQGDFQEAYDDYVRYAALFTDEMILAGTFPTRIDVDERNITPRNGTVTGELYEPIHVALVAADTGTVSFAAGLDDPAFAGVATDLREGIALGTYYGAYLRLILAELYCQSVVKLGAPVDSDTRMQEALAMFQAAETAAMDAELDDLAIAARVGQARALLWLRRFDEAAAIAATVPDDFELFAAYSGNQNSQMNEIYQFSYGVVEQLRWTVGDGTAGNRHNERWAYFDEWVDQGLIIPRPEGFESVEIGVPVSLETLYDEPDDGILLASGYEADMIEAEAAIRNGQPAAAAAIVNPRLAARGFDPAVFTGNLANDLRELARARSVGLWLTGQRQATSRRFIVDGVDLYPTGTQGDQVCFPIPQQEIDNNPNL